MVDLFDTYPEFVKMASDPAEIPRKNIKHITSRLRGNAERLRKCVPSKYSEYHKYLFNNELFPVVPFDSCLDLFVKTLQRYPINTPQVSSKGTFILEETTAKARSKSDLEIIRQQIEGMTLDSSKKHIYPVS